MEGSGDGVQEKSESDDKIAIVKRARPAGARAERFSRGEAPLGGSGNSRSRIAVIEDNEDNLLLLEVILEERYQLDQYADGPKGLAGLRARRPDLVLLDISLPGMDGLQVLEEIRRDPKLRDLGVVALTAHAMEGDRERLLAAGFDDYLAKPILDEAILFDAIEKLLGRA
jgi:two-component system, cell cycle response regulator DivK